jgi:hypothetical protein
LHTRRHLVEHDPEGEDVRAAVERFTASLLGRHVGHGSHGDAWPGQVVGWRGNRRSVRRRDGRFLRHFGKPEIQDLRVAPPADEHVRRFDVAMDDAVRVRRLDRVGDLGREVHDASLGQRPRLEQVLQRLPLEQFHHQEAASLVLAEVVDGADIGMIERRGGARLPLETLDRGGVIREPRREELERDVASQASVLRPIDNAHSAAAEFVEDPVMRDDGPDHPGRS